MCIAIPVKIVEIVDPERGIVRAETDNGRLEDVKTGLVASDPDGVGALLGRWVILHVGYVMQVLDDDDARSRLAVFAAIGGQPVSDDDLRPQ